MHPYSQCAQANHPNCKEFLGPTPAQGPIIDRVLECRGMNSESAKGFQAALVNKSLVSCKMGFRKNCQVSGVAHLRYDLHVRSNPSSVKR